MEKAILYSEKEFYEYCKLKCIGNIHRTYGSQSCYIDGGKKSEFGFKFFSEYVHVPEEPTHYPCVFVLYDGLDDVQRGVFVYEEDFKHESI